MVVLKFVTASILIVYVWADSSTLLETFVHVSQLNGKTCQDSDIVFSTSGLSDLMCAALCESKYGCGGIMYSQEQKSCVGCHTQYNADTVLPSDIGTKYFKGDWFEFEGSVYRLSKRKMDIYKGKDYCAMWGGFVARIDSEDKSQYIKAMQWEYISIWIGLTDEGHEGIWTWMNDGSVANYTDWKIGNTSTQPDGGVEDNCVAMIRGYKYTWSDRECDDEYVVLCEK